MPPTLGPFVPGTKLRPPRLPDDVLLRARLLERLDRSQILTLIIAPAGYGKTTLVSNWLAHRGRTYAWISLDGEDNTPAPFLAAFVAAVRSVFPEFGDELLALLQDATFEFTPELTSTLALPMLLNGLDLLEQDVTLVLDDYHHIAHPSIHQIVWGLLTHPPRQLRLIVTARHDPPIPPRIRCQGTVIEIRARELSFTAIETHEFLRQFDEWLDAQSIAFFVEQSEGWAVPLRLIATFMRQGQNIGPPGAAVHQCERSLLDYLDAEVIGHLPADVQTFLAYTSILPLLNGALCDDALGTALPSINSGAVLQELEKAGLFVERLDEKGDWYRYHTLFRTLLQRRLRMTHDPTSVDAMDQRARSWYEQHILHENSRRHTLCLDGRCAADLPAMNCQLMPVSDTDAANLSSLHTVQTLSVALPIGPSAHAERSLHARITFREMDVLLLLNQRLTNKEIAHALGISRDTVRQHTVNIYRKLGVNNRRQAIVQANEMGLMEARG